MVGTPGYRSPRDIADAVGFDPTYRINMTRRFEPATATLDRASARKYSSSEAYLELMRFVGRFQFYSPFNAMLIHAQMPGAHFVSEVAAGLSPGDQNRRPSDRDPATDGTSIVCV